MQTWDATKRHTYEFILLAKRAPGKWVANCKLGMFDA